MTDIEKRIAEIYAQMKPLQEQFGLKPMTIAERAIVAQNRKQQQQGMTAILGNKRPPPSWKV